MATTPQDVTDEQRGAPSELQEKARRHLWMHFTRMGGYDEQPRDPASSCAARARTSTTSTASATWTASRRCSASTPATAAPRSARPARARPKELGFYTNWSYAHPTAIELAARIAGLAPGDLNRVFFTSGGSEAVESAWKLVAPVPQAQRRRRAHQDHLARDRLPRHHLRGALDHRHHPSAHAVRAARAGRLPRAQHERLPLARGSRPALGRRRRSST